MQTACVVLFGLTILGVEIINKIEDKVEARKERKVRNAGKEAA